MNSQKKALLTFIIIFFGGVYILFSNHFFSSRPIKKLEVYKEKNNLYRYPEEIIFLGFKTGMSSDDFCQTAKALVNKGILTVDSLLFLSDSLSCYNYQVSDLYEDKNDNCSGSDCYARVEPNFDSNKKLLSIVLESIPLKLDAKFSEKYNIKKYNGKVRRVITSKVGVQNPDYNPSKYLDEKYFTDKSRLLSKFKTQNHYSYNMYNYESTYGSIIEPFVQVVRINKNTVLVYERIWELYVDVEYSFDLSQVPLDALMGHYHADLIKEQSKQKILISSRYLFIKATYTTEKYFNETKPIEELEEKTKKISHPPRQFNNEI